MEESVKWTMAKWNDMMMKLMREKMSAHEDEEDEHTGTGEQVTESVASTTHHPHHHHHHQYQHQLRASIHSES